mgnify:CR=1 FL=1
MEAIFQNKFTNQGTLVKQQLLPDIQSFHNKFHDQIKQGALEIIQSAKNYKSHNAFEKLMHEYDLSSNVTLVAASNLKIRNLAKFYCYLGPTFLNFLNGDVNYQLFWELLMNI